MIFVDVIQAPCRRNNIYRNTVIGLVNEVQGIMIQKGIKDFQNISSLKEVTYWPSDFTFTNVDKNELSP